MMLLENSVSPRVIQRMLGHSDISMTLGVYSHVVQEVFTEVAGMLGCIYDARLGGTYTPRIAGFLIHVANMLQMTRYKGVKGGKSGYFP